MGKRILKLILYGILGYVFFNVVMSLTEVIILKYFGLEENLICVFKNNMILNLTIYIILYLLIVISIYFYDRNIVKKLNEKLKKLKERREENE